MRTPLISIELCAFRTLHAILLLIRPYLIYIALPFVLGIAACKSGGIEARYTLDPPLPEAIQQSFLAQLETAELSEFAVPIDLSLADLEAIANAQVPINLQDLSQQELRSNYPRVVAQNLSIVRESPINILLDDQDQDLLLGFDIHITGNATIELGLASPNYPIDIRSRIVLKSRVAIGRNWQLDIKTQPTAYVTKPLSLNLMGYEIPFKERTEQLLQAQLNLLAPQIDADISQRLDLRSQITALWQSIQKPFRTAAPPISAWTLIKPTDIAYTQLQPIGNEKLQTTLLLRAKIATALGQQPPAALPAALPQPHLQTTTSPPSFRITMPLVMPIDSIEPLVKPQLLGQRFQISGNQHIVIEDIDLIGAGDRVVVKATVSGNAVSGNIVMAGIPQLDEANQIFHFEQFDYTLETGNLLKDKAAWLINKVFLRSVAQKMQFDATAALADARQKLQLQLNNMVLPQSQLQGNISSLRATSSYMENNVLRIDIRTEGHTQLHIKPILPK